MKRSLQGEKVYVWEKVVELGVFVLLRREGLVGEIQRKGGNLGSSSVH